MEHQEKSSKLESFLFKFTRAFALLGAIAGMIAIAIVLFMLIKPTSGTYVSLNDLNTASTASNDSVSEASANSGKKLVYPENVKKYLSGDNEPILKNWLRGLPRYEQRQDFLDNLSEVIADAENDKIDMNNAINNYKTVKLSKLSKSGIEEYEDIGKKIALYVAIFSLILLITLMSLILVMLAIERNTRVKTQ